VPEAALPGYVPSRTAESKAVNVVEIDPGQVPPVSNEIGGVKLEAGRNPGCRAPSSDLGPSTGGPRVDPSLKEIQEIIDRRVAGSVSLSRPIWLAAFGINERKVPTGWAGCSSPTMLPIFTVLPEDRA
jgi:hypothetical protein